MKRRLAISLVLVALSFTVGAGCFGRFAATKAVQKFNLDISEDKWFRECTFVALYIVTVYPVCGFLDLFIFNSIEFWNGTNPINGEAALLSRAGDTRTIDAPDGSRATLTLLEDGAIDCRIVAPGGAETKLRLVRKDGCLTASDPEGQVIARAFIDEAARMQ